MEGEAQKISFVLLDDLVQNWSQVLDERVKSSLILSHVLDRQGSRLKEQVGVLLVHLIELGQFDDELLEHTADFVRHRRDLVLRDRYDSEQSSHDVLVLVLRQLVADLGQQSIDDLLRDVALVQDRFFGALLALKEQLFYTVGSVRVVDLHVGVDEPVAEVEVVEQVLIRQLVPETEHHSETGGLQHGQVVQLSLLQFWDH